MALITCPECGKEISDQAISCPNCGYAMKKEETAEPIVVVSEENTPQPPVKKYLLKTFLLWLLPVVELIVALLTTWFSSSIGISLHGALAFNAVLSGILLIRIVRAISDGKKRKSKVYRNVIAMVLCACFLLLNGGLLLVDTVVTSEDDAEVISACKDLRSRLKSPDSLQIHSITVMKNQEHHVTYLDIDYSAQNGFGGMSRSTVRYKNGTLFGWMDMTAEDTEILTSKDTITKEIDAARIERKLK